MDQSVPESDPSIASRGRSCSVLFQQLWKGLETSTWQALLPTAVVKEESKRYELWARNIAALQDANLPSSLEYRIRDDESARGIVKKALMYLEESLEMAISIVGGEKTNETWESASFDESSDAEMKAISSQPENPDALTSSELKELSLAIQEGITNLFELSMIIRKKPEKDEYIRASMEYDIDPTADIIHVGDKYPPARKGDTWLMQRLGTAITRRRQYLLYRKDHQKKMEQVHLAKKGVDGKTVWSGEKASTYLPDEKFGDYRQQIPGPMALAPQKLSQSARTEYADSSKGKDGVADLLRTPLLPKDSDGMRVGYNQHFECPYCWRPQKVQDKNAWKKHVFSDLRPYVCTFEACGLNMFESQHQWFDHELRFHRKQWLCQYCEDSHPTSRPDLQIHMKELHRDEFQGSNIDLLLDTCQVLRIDATNCPLCTEYGEKLQRINQSNKCDVSLKQFQQHLGRHMEQLALAALPQEDVDEDDTDGSALEEIELVELVDDEIDSPPSITPKFGRSVIVSNISPQTSVYESREFFRFNSKIRLPYVRLLRGDGKTKSAKVRYEDSMAARMAEAKLDGMYLGPNIISVRTEMLGTNERDEEAFDSEDEGSSKLEYIDRRMRSESSSPSVVGHSGNPPVANPPQSTLRRIGNRMGLGSKTGKEKKGSSDYDDFWRVEGPTTQSSQEKSEWTDQVGSATGEFGIGRDIYSIEGQEDGESRPGPTISGRLVEAHPRMLFVSGLEHHIDSDTLRAKFEEFGVVEEARVVVDLEAALSKGFGYVTYLHPSEADAAILAMNDTEFGGRTIWVGRAAAPDLRSDN